MNEEIDPSVEAKAPVEDQAQAPGNEAEEAKVEVVEEAPVDPIEALEAEVAKFRDESLRRAAEMDNYRKRMAKELEDSRKFANQRLLSELLPVLDNFGMGMQMAEKEQGSMLYQGMAMVQGQLDEFFSSQGVKIVEVAEGSPFDPNFHDAVSQEVSTEIPEGHVLRVVRKGFLISDRLLRPANVIVAKAEEEESVKEEAGEASAEG